MDKKTLFVVCISDGDSDANGMEMSTCVGFDLSELLDSTFSLYKDKWEVLVEDESMRFVDGVYVDANFNPCKTREEFIYEMGHFHYVTIQLDNSHVQYELHTHQISVS